MHLTAPQVVGRRSDFSDSDKLAYALQWYSGIQADAFQRALWNSRGLSGGKLIERLISRVDGIVNSWFKESDEGTGQFTIILIRDTDLPETPEDAELDHAAAARKSRASEKKDVGDRGRMVSMGRWVHRDQDWYEKEGKEKEEEEKKSKNASMSVTKGQEDIEVNKLSAITSSSGDGSGRPKGDSYIADLNRRWLTKFLIGKAHYGKYYKECRKLTLSRCTRPGFTSHPRLIDI